MASRKTLPSFTRKVRPDPPVEEIPIGEEELSRPSEARPATQSDSLISVIPCPPSIANPPLLHAPVPSRSHSGDGLPPWRGRGTWRRPTHARASVVGLYEPSWRIYEAPRPQTPRARRSEALEESPQAIPPFSAVPLGSSMLWVNQSGPGQCSPYQMWRGAY